MITAEEEAELVVKAQAGDIPATQELILRYQWLIFRLAELQTKEGHFEDYVQEGTLALYHALKSFDLTRGTRFGTYARFWVMNYFQKYNKQENNLPPQPAYPIEATYEIEDDLEQSIVMEKLYQVLANIEDGLSERQKAVLILRIKGGLSLQDTANRLGVSKARAGQLHHAIIRKLQAELYG